VTGYTVDLGALQVVAESIQAVLDELGSLGINGEQESGSPIENVALSMDDMGSLMLADITSDALQRAHYALRTALHNATQLAASLRAIEGSYQQVESQVGGLFDQIHHAISTVTTRPAAGAPAHRPAAGSLFGALSGGER
jgi:hypothetical protein